MQYAASTALYKDAEPLSSYAAVGNSSQQKQHVAATPSPYLACVREEHRPSGRRCSWNPQTKLMLATIIVLVGAVLGLALYVGLTKGMSVPVDANNVWHPS
jgi:hypothetical protein